MAKVNCKYHPQLPARWYCSSCAVNLCTQCSKKLGPPQNTHVCHSCGAELDSLGLGNLIQPFWERIPKFFLYPIRVDALMYLAVLSVVSLGVFLPLAGIIVALAIPYALLKYGYLILNHTAHGNLSPPEILGPNLTENDHLPFKQMVVILLMVVLVAGAGAIAAPLGIAALLFMLFTMPASIMSMAINRSIGKALNPVMLGAIIRRIGWPYLILYVFLLLLSGGSTAAQELLAAVLPRWLLMMLTTFVSGYFTVIMFNMMGYVVYQYHEPLGFDGVRDFNEVDESPAPARSNAPAAASADPFENELNILINEGKIEEAKSRLREKMRVSNATLLQRERYHKLLQLSKDSEECSRHGLEYVHTLIDSEQPGKALEVYGECLTLDSGFKLRNGRDTYHLAVRAHGMGKPDLALRILNKFTQRYAQHPDTPHAYFLVAKLLCEHKGQDGQARKVLDDLLQKFPDHELVTEIKAYRDLVQKLAGAGEAAAGAGA